MPLETESFPAAVESWHVEQDRTPGDPARARMAIASRVVELTRRLGDQVCARTWQVEEEKTQRAAARLWRCIDFHWRQFGASSPCALATVVERLESGNWGNSSGRPNVLKEVVLAQAVEWYDKKAVEMFEREYMPVVEATARRAGGDRAADALGNFTAELILPRSDRPPRISSYQGRTSLAGWLRAVVVNFWTSAMRQQRGRSVSPHPEVIVSQSADAVSHEQSDCEQLLSPLFGQAVGVLGIEDRLILKMLVLEGVPQHALANSLGINSGTLTRRRQRAAAMVFAQIREQSLQSRNPAQAADCLDAVLTGGSRELREKLADVLAGGVRSVASSPKLDGPRVEEGT